MHFALSSKIEWITSGQDGGVGRHGLPPCISTSKLQLKYKTTITPNHQKSNWIKVLTTIELKKPRPSRLVGVVKMQNGLVPHPRVVNKKFGRYILGAGSPSPHQVPEPRVLVQGRYIPITSGCKNQQVLSRWKKHLESQAVPLKETTQELTHTHYLWALAPG